MERIRKVLMFCGFCVAALQMGFAILPAHAAENADAPFDAKSAAEFMSANPDFKKCAADFESRADTLYAENKFADAAASYFAAKFFGFFGANVPDMPRELAEYMLASPELLSDFFSAISPKDDAPKVAGAIIDIYKSDPENFKKYPRLALAIALVFDTPPPKIWPHAQVSEKYLPRKFPAPAEAFAEWKAARDRGRLLFQFERMSLGELKYLVASLATSEDRQWAQKSISINASNIGKLYSSVAYNYSRITAKQYDWNGSDYRLKTIRETGGICTDQAYFAAEAAKARGVPAFIFAGAGADGFHAWTAAMKKPGSWEFGIGRYEGARYVTGTTIDPQTWEIASDHDLESLREGFRNGAKYRENELHTIFAEKFFKSGDYSSAEKSARKALSLDKRNAKTWRILIDALQKSGDEKKVLSALDEAVKAFFKYPDIDAEFRRELISKLKATSKEDEARKLSTSIILKTKSSRPDIAMSFARAELEGDIASGEAEKLATSYKRLLGVFKSDAAMSATGITIPIINALLKKGKIDETDEIMKITRQTLKTSRDSTLTQLLDNIDRQLSVIKSKIKAAK